MLLGQFGPSFLSPHSLYSLIHSISLVPDMDPDPYERAWLIGLSHGDSVDDLQRNISRDPIFDRESLRPWNGYGAADPFAIFVRDRWYLFFELLVRNEGNAVIAVASSYDLKQWQVLGIALKESHHLSYPFVFEHGGEIYMMPESKSVRQVNLYRAVDFPLRWERCATLVTGAIMDASIIQHRDRWWMFAGWKSYWLKLFHAPSPLGPWQSHWMPIARAYSKKNVRPGGRPVHMPVHIADGKGSILRFAQDNRKCYGHQIQAMKVTQLNRLWFRERPYREEPIFSPAGTGWYCDRMHHLDLHPNISNTFPGRWIGFVDGCN